MNPIRQYMFIDKGTQKVPQGEILFAVLPENRTKNFVHRIDGNEFSFLGVVKLVYIYDSQTEDDYVYRFDGYRF